MTDQSADPQTIRLQGLTLRAPADWERVGASDVALTMAAPPEPDEEGTRPHLVVTTTPSTASIHRLSSETMTAAVTGADSSYVVSCELWDAGEHPARRIELTHRVGSEQIDVIKHLVATPDRAVELTFSCPVGARSVYAELANGIASSLEITQEET